MISAGGVSPRVSAGVDAFRGRLAIVTPFAPKEGDLERTRLIDVGATIRRLRDQRKVAYNQNTRKRRGGGAGRKAPIVDPPAL
jgi:hypothetical protein